MTLLNKKAPAFKRPNQDGDERTLKDYAGKWLVLYFYPRDNTPGCTLEARDFTALLPEFKKYGAHIVGVSRDTPKSHCGFIDKQGLSVELLSDTDHTMQEAYGVWRPKKFMGREFLGTVRSTFLINPDGKIVHVWDPVSAKGHAQDVLETLKAQH